MATEHLDALLGARQKAAVSADVFVKLETRLLFLLNKQHLQTVSPLRRARQLPAREQRGGEVLWFSARGPPPLQKHLITLCFLSSKREQNPAWSQLPGWRGCFQRLSTRLPWAQPEADPGTGTGMSWTMTHRIYHMVRCGCKCPCALCHRTPRGKGCLAGSAMSP